MANRRQTFSQIELTRALKAALAAGIDMRDRAVVIRPDGEIRLEPVTIREASAAGSSNSVDRLFAKAR